MEQPDANQNQAQVLGELADLRRFAGVPKEFWPRYVASVGALCHAARASLLLRNPQSSNEWRRLVEWTAGTGTPRLATAFIGQLESVAERCARERQVLLPLDSTPARGTGPHMLATRVKLQRTEEDCIAVCLLTDVSQATAQEMLLRLSLAADVPESYQENLAARQAKGDVEKFASALDLAVLVNAEKKFLAAALAFCNGVATRFKCDRVSLGWLERGYLRLRAISRTEKFDRQMAAARALEVAMEEALDQDDEVVWPAPEGATVVTRDHEAFARDQRVAHLCSLPLRVENKPVAVLTCERSEGAFSPTELQQLRLCADLLARRMADLKHYDRWFGARWATAVRETFARILGPEHTWAKLLAVVIVALLAALCFVRVPYRVEGNFILRSDEVAYLTVPFEGYIGQVFARPGDVIPRGGKLLSLKTSELELEQSAALADLNRYQREAEKARAARSLAEMRIAQALAEEAQARLDLVRFRISQAVVPSPFDGVIVEGDLRDRLGAPVKQGDVLMKVARIDALYVEAEVNERDIHEVLGKSTGEIAFVSQPKLKFPVRIETVEQAAVSKPDANLFRIRCAVEGGPQPWWRPGMSGLCKLNVDRRTLLWIITHRTVDFLRLYLWW